ncbi:MAG: hypothetical protein AB8B55_19655 [Mariniblastus sp.]
MDHAISATQESESVQAASGSPTAISLVGSGSLAGPDFSCGAGTLGCLRVLVFGVIAFVIWNEDIVSSLLLGETFRRPMGIMKLIRQASDALGRPLNDFTTLQTLKWATLAFSLMACVGAFKRLSLPLATVGYLVFAGILREYSHLFHSGLLSLYLATALCFMPCADAVSVDRWLGRTRENRSREFYGWCRFACWAMIAICYFGAGYSKLTNGGLMWWAGENLRQIVLTDCMNPMMFDWDVGLKLKDMPLAMFAGMGLWALVIETLYPMVLFSRWARFVFPVAAVGMHLGIFFFQNILFLDLILLQLMFVNWDRVVGQSAAVNGATKSDADSVSKIVLMMIFVLLLMVVTKIEHYPLTSWQMYSGKGNGEQAIYFSCKETLADGQTQIARFETVFPVLTDTRYRDVLLWIREKPDHLREFARRYIQLTNANREQPYKIQEVRMQRRSWSIDKSADDYDADVLLDEVVVAAPQ